MPEPDLIATPDDSRFSEEQLAAARDLLDLEWDAPRRLSGLLAEARRRDEDPYGLAYLVALIAVHAASPPVGTAYRQGERRCCSPWTTAPNSTTPTSAAPTSSSAAPCSTPRAWPPTARSPRDGRPPHPDSPTPAPHARPGTSHHQEHHP
ncbi:hypothetical protein ACFQVA_04260 [Actinomadura keratinilytica]